MNQLIAIALGGGCGAVVRFLISSGLYQWLGRGLPYGTLVVNVIGSFLIGLLTEALILQRLSFSLEYRAAILVGFIGAFTTFSTFSLETIYENKENGAFWASDQHFAVAVPRHAEQFCQRIKGKAEVAATGLRPASRILVDADQPVNQNARCLSC